MVAVFFFEGEGGIRCYKVTGVQTCALPISGVAGRAHVEVRDRELRARELLRDRRLLRGEQEARTVVVVEALARSEGIRVGNEGRYRWWRFIYKKKRKVLIALRGNVTILYEH